MGKSPVLLVCLFAHPAHCKKHMCIYLPNCLFLGLPPASVVSQNSDPGVLCSPARAIGFLSHARVAEGGDVLVWSVF